MSDAEPTYLQPKPGIYLSAMLAPVVVLLVALALGFAFYLRAGELATMDEVLDRQAETGGLYSTVTFYRYAAYRHALYARAPADSVAIGSSRVWQFYPESFKAPFMSLGSTVFGVDQALYAIDRIAETHPPKFVLFGVDYWWFNDQYVEPLNFYGPTAHAERYAPPLGEYLQPWKWLAQGKLAPGLFTQTLAGKNENTGIAGIVGGDGFDARGVPHFDGEVGGKHAPADAGFGESLRDIARGARNFPHGESYSRDRWETYENALKKLEKGGYEVVLFMPPIAPTVYDAMMESGEYGYIAELGAKLAEQDDFEFYDYTDPAKLDATDCEFRDGLHGGAVVYRRILRDIAAKTQTSLPERLDMAEVEAAIRDSAGYVTHPHDVEVDFLELGCDK